MVYDGLSRHFFRPVKLSKMLLLVVLLLPRVPPALVKRICNSKIWSSSLFQAWAVEKDKCEWKLDGTVHLPQ